MRRFVPDANTEQLALNFDGQPTIEPPVVEEVRTIKKLIEAKLKKVEKKKPKRLPIPEHLPRTIITIEPQQDVSGWKKIGELVTEELDYTPAEFHVNRYVRPKYARPKATESDIETSSTTDAGTATENTVSSLPAIVVGTLPERPIPKGIPSAGLLAHILIRSQSV